MKLTHLNKEFLLKQYRPEFLYARENWDDANIWSVVIQDQAKNGLICIVLHQLMCWKY